MFAKLFGVNVDVQEVMMSVWYGTALAPASPCDLDFFPDLVSTTRKERKRRMRLIHTALLSPRPLLSLPLMKLKCSTTTQETILAVEIIISCLWKC